MIQVGRRYLDVMFSLNRFKKMQKGDRIRATGQRHEDRIADLKKMVSMNGSQHLFDDVIHISKIQTRTDKVNY